MIKNLFSQIAMVILLTGISFAEKNNSEYRIFPIVNGSSIDVKLNFAYSITGNVTDSKGQPLIGVSIKVKGTNNGASSDVKGQYTLNLNSEDAILVFTYIGYITQEISVNSRTVINVSLEEDARSLDEVVVIGYGTVRKSDLTGSVSSVGSKEINAIPAANVMQALAGRAPGVQVKQNNGQPGAPISIRIRGTNSIVGNNEPLYVVDGFPVNDALSINNSSIERIEVLKDASAVAIYGSRASNGVVLITTKKGKAGQTKVSFENSFGSQQLIRKMEMMNPLEYANYFNYIQRSLGRAEIFTASKLQEFAAMGEGTDWQDVVFRKSPIQNYILSVSGGDQKSQFSITGGLFDQQGVIRNSDYKRYSLNSNFHHNISEKFDFDVALTLSKNKSARQQSEQGRFGTSLQGRVYGIPSYLPVYNADGTYAEPVLLDPRVSEALWNPLNFINETSNILGQNNILLSGGVNYKIVDGLSLRVSGGVESRNSLTNFYQTKKFQNVRDGVASVLSGEYTSLLNENILSYNKVLNGKHSISAVAGATYQSFQNTTLGGSGRNFLSDVTESYSLSSAGLPGIPTSAFSESTLLSGLGRINYTFDNRYLFTVSFRADGSSVYSPGNKWGYYPSAAFSWRLSEEKFLNLENTIINDLRLKASWGRAGSQAIAPYSTMNQLNPGTTVFGTSLVTTMSPSARLASDLKWETTEQSNFGMELSLLNDRIGVTADYYIKKTSDLLNAVQLPRSSGYTNALRNVGVIGNKGFEFGINSKIFNTSKFKWDLDANMTFNRSKVLKLYGGVDILAGQLQMIRFTDFANTYREGEPLGVIYGYKENGYTSNGLIQYVDQNNDGKIDIKDKVKIGDPNAKLIFGLNSNMNYKNFSFSMFLTGSQGNSIVNMSAVAFSIDNTNGTNKLKDVVNNYWTPQNMTAKYPAPLPTNVYRFSDRYVEDGSYARLRNIELGYNFSPLKGFAGVQNALIYVSGQNLLTLTKYSWIDPDVNTRGGSSSLDQGIDYASYPSAKSITAGLRVNF
ncbi:TonB-dependent receptor [Daejeonella sp.]|uniref:SusC/RagA family TonB-linked outer membrane protein n=1 Tax=Daejeonella sp. TaxID=2805397 RepID=UPI0030BA8245